MLDHNKNPTKRRKYLLGSLAVIVVFIGIYLAILFSQFDSGSFGVASTGGCPQCAGKNWCWQTVYQNTALWGFPAIIFGVSLRSHTWEYNPSFLRENLNWRGLVRAIISFVFWTPVIFYRFPAFDTKVLSILGTPVKNTIATPLFFVLRPWLFKIMKMEVKGDVMEVRNEVDPDYRAMDKLKGYEHDENVNEFAAMKK